MTTDAASNGSDPERNDFLDGLNQHRRLLVRTVQGLSDEQARQTPTVSQLCLGGIIKHVTRVEEGWARFIEEGPSAIGRADQAAYEAHAAGFRMTEGDTVAGLIAGYEAAAKRTDELVVALPSLDTSHPLPEAPWFKDRARWSARRVLLHIVAETAQHAGHADIIRETIDGSKSMG